MTDSVFANAVKVATSTTGTGTMTLGSAVSGFRGTSALTNGATYSYTIVDGSNYEHGQGVYTSSGTTLTRATVDDSSNSGSAINLSGSGVTVLVGLLLARDLAVTGTGSFARATSPTFVTPALGTPASGTLTNCTGYTVANLGGLGTGVGTILAAGKTGTGNLVADNTPTIITPIAMSVSSSGPGATLELHNQNSGGSAASPGLFFSGFNGGARPVWGRISAQRNGSIDSGDVVIQSVNGGSYTSGITINTNNEFVINGGYIKAASGILTFGSPIAIGSTTISTSFTGGTIGASLQLYNGSSSGGDAGALVLGGDNGGFQKYGRIYGTRNGGSDYGDLIFQSVAASSYNTGFILTAGNDVYAGSDNAQTLGGPSNRWSTVYAGTGSINTSDACEKTDVRALTPDEIAAAKALAVEIGAFKFLDSVAIKGEAARSHIGMTVQRAIEVMESYGLDPFVYGFICHDHEESAPAQYDEDGALAAPEKPGFDRYGFRSDELMLFLARGFEARLAALEAAA